MIPFRRIPVLCITIATMCCISCEMAFAKPAIFDAESFAQAKARAVKEGKLFVVDCTASWCGPCHAMDETTWQDPSVTTWFKENAVAVQIDVDRDDRLAAELRVSAMPTVIVYQPGQTAEFAREVGYQRPVELLTWLKASKSGERPIDVLREQAAVAIKKGEGEVQARYELANGMVEAGQLPGATGQYLWLWNNIPNKDSTKMELRNSTMPAEITRLIAKYPPAKKHFISLRNEAEKSNRDDWINLNRMLGDDQITLEWFDSARKDPERSSELQQASSSLKRVLLAHDRFADAALFYPNPLKQLSQINEGGKTGKDDSQTDSLHKIAVEMYACLLAAGRETEAEQVAAESLKSDKDGSLRQQLLKAADHARIPLFAKAQVTVKGREREAGLIGGAILLLAVLVLASRFLSKSK